MLKVGSIAWGVRDLPRAIQFWSAALNYEPLRESSPDWAILVPHNGAGGWYRTPILVVSVNVV